jgi:hypothetical protein
VRHSSGYFLNTNDSPFGYQDPFTTLNVSARIYNQAWELALIARNLTNEFYAVSGGDKPLGPRGQTTANLGRPRQVILQVTRRF